MIPDTPTEARLSPRTLVPLGAFLGLVLVSTAGAVWLNDALRDLGSRLDGLTKDVGEIRTQLERMDSRDLQKEAFRSWVLLLKARNPDLNIPIPGD